MEKEQASRFNMFNTTQHYLDMHTDVWSVVPKIVQYKNTFDSLIAGIRAKSTDIAENKNIPSQMFRLGSILGGLNGF